MVNSWRWPLTLNIVSQLYEIFSKNKKNVLHHVAGYTRPRTNLILLPFQREWQKI